MVEVITYMAAWLLGVVELRVAEKRLITAFVRPTTTFIKLLFVVLSRDFRSLNAISVGLVLTRGSRWQQCHYVSYHYNMPSSLKTPPLLTIS